MGAGLIASPAVISSARAQGLDSVTLGIPGSVSDGSFFAAIHKGYFKDQGINIVPAAFQAGSQLVAPLGAGQVDAAAGATSAGLYNAVARGIDIKIAADKSSNMPGYCYMALLVRQDHVDSGRYKSFEDLKGFRVAEAGKAGAPGSTLNEAMKKGGLKYDDATHVYNMPYPDMAAALQNKAIDAAIVTEPSSTRARKMGVAVRIPSDLFYPIQNVAPLLCSGKFLKERKEVAQRFMIAYLKGVRFYNDACKDGRLAGPNAEELIQMMVTSSEVKDPQIYREATPNGVDPNGRLNMDSLNKDLAFYKEMKLVAAEVKVEDALDTSFMEAAVKALGPYVPAK
ncbi:ABC transporter substrate-binding protein [Xanthobacter dioxanivorans]|uniref:ABC transporter substrate-binding protein n=1 Tax=Xanthobacter dioxanivorans TaxID=2528964 RepID=A0A974PUU5_9HYPH|nr:ABC transporter substrate-binding protein [Xanthobacter dioxanivorans]